MKAKEELFARKLSSELMAKTAVVGHLIYGYEGSYQWVWHKNDYPAFQKTSILNAVMSVVTEIAPKRVEALKDAPAWAIASEKNAVRRVDIGTYWTFIGWWSSETDLTFRMFERKWLDNQIQKAESGIRFEDCHGNHLFTIADGDCIRTVSSEYGRTQDWRVRYIDDSHFEVNEKDSSAGPFWIYHRIQFGDMVPSYYKTVIPLRESLPESCWVAVPENGVTIEEFLSDSDMIVSDSNLGLFNLRRGESLDQAEKVSIEEMATAKEVNTREGVTPVQVQAMIAGALFGWDNILADPASYNDDGTLKKEAERKALRQV